jgi:hypothetical protein
MFGVYDYSYFFTTFLDERIRHGDHISRAEELRSQGPCSLRSQTLSPTLSTKFLIGLALMIGLSNSALAADWQYCLAPSHTEHKVYISAPFPSSEGSPDSALDRVLYRSGVRHDDVQCPRADDERSIQIMRRDAISFNQKSGNQIVNLNWKP